MRKLDSFFWYGAALFVAGYGTALAQPANSDASRDVPLIRQVLNDVLSSNANGVGTNWTNPQTRDYGVITPRTSYAASNGQQCGAYDRTWVVNGNESTYSGTACKDAEGVWRVQGIETLAGQRVITASAVPPANTPAPPVSNPAPSTSPQVASANPPPSTAQPQQRPADSAAKPAAGQNQPPRASPPAAVLSTNLSRDEIMAVELYLQRLGLRAGAPSGNFDAATQEAARAFWRNQKKTGQPVVDENFLTELQIAISTDRSRGGVTPVVITTTERIGSVPPATSNVDALLK